MKTKYKIHFAYIISILVVIIIFLLTIKLSGNDDLIKYVSFSSTIASLLLAILAIVYAYLSNSALGNNILLIDNVSRELKYNTDKLTAISDSIVEDVKNIPSAIELVSNKVENIPKQINDLMMTTTVSEKSEVTENVKFINEKFVVNYLENTSISGLIFLKAICIANDKNVSVDLIDLAHEFSYLYLEYLEGYMVACYSSTLLNYVSLAKKKYHFSFVNEYLKNNIDRIMATKLKSFFLNKDFSEANKETITNSPRYLEKYFNNLQNKSE